MLATYSSKLPVGVSIDVMVLLPIRANLFLAWERSSKTDRGWEYPLLWNTLYSPLLTNPESNMINFHNHNINYTMTHIHVPATVIPLSVISFTT